VRPEQIEFWQRRRGRLHTRIRVELDPDGIDVAAMKITRLQP
jgi:pyridoxamine 5'-phosphate oxidase